MEKNSKMITAAEAREKSENSEKALAKIYKEINYLAENGNTELCWTISYLSEKLIERLRVSLTSIGYDVNIVDDYITDPVSDNEIKRPSFLVIRW